MKSFLYYIKKKCYYCFMEIIKTLNNDELTLKIVGELNTTTYQQLEEEVSKSLNGIKTLIYDFEKLEYISSAGLRVLLISKKTMDKQGKMIVRNANKNVMEIFKITGFANVLDFE